MNSKLRAVIGGDIQPMGPGLLTKYTRFVLIVVVGLGICVLFLNPDVRYNDECGPFFIDFIAFGLRVSGFRIVI